ncbi:MAG: cytochrome P450 [Methylocella sp.]
MICSRRRELARACSRVRRRAVAITSSSPSPFRPRLRLGEAAGAHHLPAHIPFGSGPRICPGRALALLEMKLLLSMLYRHFNVERLGGAEGVREHFAITMSPVGLKVRLRRRSSALAGTETA